MASSPGWKAAPKPRGHAWVDWGHPRAKELNAAWMMNTQGAKIRNLITRGSPNAQDYTVEEGKNFRDLVLNGAQASFALSGQGLEGGAALTHDGTANVYYQSENVGTKVNAPATDVQLTISYTFRPANNTETLRGICQLSSDGKPQDGTPEILHQQNGSVIRWYVGAYTSTDYTFFAGEVLRIASVSDTSGHKFFVNGQQIATLGADDIPENRYFYIGTGYTDSAKGEYGSCMIWTRALSNAEIMDDYLNPFDIFIQDMPVWLPVAAAAAVALPSVLMAPYQPTAQRN